MSKKTDELDFNERVFNIGNLSIRGKYIGELGIYTKQSFVCYDNLILGGLGRVFHTFNYLEGVYGVIIPIDKNQEQAETRLRGLKIELQELEFGGMHCELNEYNGLRYFEIKRAGFPTQESSETIEKINGLAGRLMEEFEVKP